MLLAQLGIKNLEKIVHDKKEEIDQPFRGYFVTFLSQSSLDRKAFSRAALVFSLQFWLME